MNDSQPTVFVSRDLDSNSDLYNLLKEIKADFYATSLIDFTPVSFTIPATEWLFFYSKTAVRHFFQSIENKVELDNYKFAAFGKSTGKLLEEKIGKHLNFYGVAQKEPVAISLTESIGDQSICFVVGKQSLRSVQSLLPKHIQQSEIIVYNNEGNKSIELKKYDIAVITSPLNAFTFLSSGGSADHFISIGQTTSNALASKNITSIIAPTPSEEGLSQSLKRLCQEISEDNSK